MVLIPGLVSKQDKLIASSEHLGSLEPISKSQFSAHTFSNLIKKQLNKDKSA